MDFGPGIQDSIFFPSGTGDSSNTHKSDFWGNRDIFHLKPASSKTIERLLSSSHLESVRSKKNFANGDSPKTKNGKRFLFS